MDTPKIKAVDELQEKLKTYAKLYKQFSTQHNKRGGYTKGGGGVLQQLVDAKADLFEHLRAPYIIRELVGPFLIRDWKVLQYLGASSSDHVSVIMPDQPVVGGIQNPPSLRIKVRGSDDIWHVVISVTYGFEVRRAGLGVNIDVSSGMTGIVDISDYIDTKMNIFVNQYRGVRLSEYNQNDVTSINAYHDAFHAGWQAHPSDNFDIQDQDRVKDTEQGLHPITPFGAHINTCTSDVRENDVFLINYVTFITGSESGIDLSYNNDGTLVFRSPNITAR